MVGGPSSGYSFRRFVGTGVLSSSDVRTFERSEKRQKQITAGGLPSAPAGFCYSAPRTFERPNSLTSVGQNAQRPGAPAQPNCPAGLSSRHVYGAFSSSSCTNSSGELSAARRRVISGSLANCASLPSTGRYWLLTSSGG